MYELCGNERYSFDRATLDHPAAFSGNRGFETVSGLGHRPSAVPGTFARFEFNPAGLLPGYPSGQPVAENEIEIFPGLSDIDIAMFKSAWRDCAAGLPATRAIGRRCGALYGSHEAMNRTHLFIFAVLAASLPGRSEASSDQRVLVDLPEMMQQHMLSNMRDHLAAINEILVYLGNGELDKASETAEYRLGMSSLQSHGASHMARFMPEGMQQAGTAMHKAASRFALKAQEGEILPAYRALSNITSACVACHSGYRIK